ncbi:TetR/AcrR family transcriptional regulator [Streptomyces sp. NPDC051018]|uniref:TetR/AcrR family transcriptional regulator n=1 Tax=Streptomyces sp. NPDC051018 TaxID=3365639 RepID=UPI00378B0198
MNDSSTTRTARSRGAILQAAIDICAERGYHAVTMEAIAARARVGKPTLYRWWPTKGALFLDALTDRIGEQFFLYPDTGDIRVDLRNWLHGVIRLFTDPHYRELTAGVIGSLQHDQELATVVHEQVHVNMKKRNNERLLVARKAGQLPDIDLGLLDDMLVAPMWYRLLVTGEPLTTEYADAVLATLLGPDPVATDGS